jgi:hypothetical protein
LEYITLDVLDDGNVKHKDWICDAVCTSRFSNIIQFIVEEETSEFFKNQLDRNKREDILDLDVKILDRALKRASSDGVWDQDDYDQMFCLVKKYKNLMLE